MKARPAFPALAVLPILNTDTETRSLLQSKLILQSLKPFHSSQSRTGLMHSLPVNVRPDVLWRVVIHNTFDPVDVDASCGCVCADQPSGWHNSLRNEDKIHLTAVWQKKDLNALVREIFQISLDLLLVIRYFLITFLLLYTHTGRLTVGSFLVQIPSASSFSHQERVWRRIQQLELHQRAAPAGEV